MSIRQRRAGISSKKPPRKPPPKVPTPADPEQLLRDVAHWWAHVVGLLDGIQSTAEDIGREASDPESPLYTATHSEHWLRFAGALQDSGVSNCSVTFAPNLPDPLRSLAGKDGAA